MFNLLVVICPVLLLQLIDIRILFILLLIYSVSFYELCKCWLVIIFLLLWYISMSLTFCGILILLNNWLNCHFWVSSYGFCCLSISLLLWWYNWLNNFNRFRLLIKSIIWNLMWALNRLEQVLDLRCLVNYSLHILFIVKWSIVDLSWYTSWF
jgi:hypothetical protein